MKMISHKLQGFNWLLFQYTICNQLPAIKLLVSAIMHNVIGYYHEINLNISDSSFVVVVKYHVRDDFQQYLNNSRFCLGMIFDYHGTGKQKLVYSSKN